MSRVLAESMPNRTSLEPLYRQARRLLESRIRSGALAPGHPIPPLKALCVELGVSEITVRRAVQELIVDGFLRTTVGVGTFVASDIPRARVALVVVGFDDTRWRLRSRAFGDLIGGVGAVVWARNAVLTIVRLRDEPAMEAFIRALDDHRAVDGVVLRPDGELRVEWVRAFEERALPYVAVKRRLAQRTAVHVAEDDFGDAYLATKHLAEVGHRRIALVAPPLTLYRERLDGYRRALAENAIPFDDRLVVITKDFFTEDGSGAMLQVLQQKPRPTAVFAAGAYLAFGCCRTLTEAGLRVPEDMSVVAHDSGEIAAQMQPALTSVGHTLFELGQAAGEILLDQILSPSGSPVASVVLPAQLTRRDSTAAPNLA